MLGRLVENELKVTLDERDEKYSLNEEKSDSDLNKIKEQKIETEENLISSIFNLYHHL